MGYQQKFKKELKIWQQAALPGIFVLIVVVIARLCGWLQVFEWMALDLLLRLRPAEATDDKVVIVGITEKDIRSVGSYPIPDSEIAKLIRTLQKYKPIVIGLDIVRNIPVDPGHAELIDVFQQSNNLIGIEKALPPDEILPPPQLPPAQVGFSDIIPDKDGKYRRYLLFTVSPKNHNENKYSLSLRLAIGYLSTQGIKIGNGRHDRSTIRFATTELPRILPNSGGYVGVNASGIKTLVNFRSGNQPFRVLSLNDIKTGQLDPTWLQGKIVLIGIIASSVPDFVNSSAIVSSQIPGELSGVEFHAHVCSQIIHAVTNGRSLLNFWSDEWEYLWIIAWGFVPIIIGRLTQSVWKNLIAVVVAGLCLIGIGYILILWGWWIPIAPNLLFLGINGMGMSAFAFYQHDQAQKFKINERQHTIEHAFTVIHNGPLQTLANTLRHMHAQDLPNEQLILQLEKLNLEIREIGEYLKLEALAPDESLRLGSSLKLDLKRPVHELFYEVYTSTLERVDLEYLKNIKVKIRTFEPIDDKCLNLEIKRELCLFLEEALCNVGKHAKGVKRIEAVGKQDQNIYTLRIKDNGPGLISSVESKGTKQLRNTAKKLGGDFRRESLYPKGTVCEITWKLVNVKNIFY